MTNSNDHTGPASPPPPAGQRPTGARLRDAVFALSPQVVRHALANVAREIIMAGRKARLYPHVAFGRRVAVDDRCRFGEHVTIGPESYVFGSSFGRYSFAAFRLWARNAEVGPFCSIGPGAIIGIGRHPSRHFVSTHPATFSSAWDPRSRLAVHPFEEHAPVTIGPDVWIGANTFVGPGIKVGPGAIIGTGAVVTRDVEPYAIVVGAPARVLRFRHTEPDIAFLLGLKWWDLPVTEIRRLAEVFHDVALVRDAVRADRLNTP